ncbi:MAG: TIGR03013 family PEP-CTERM/XrtA system glycosyltransferase [Gammaproteobacteria bacterium]
MIRLFRHYVPFWFLVLAVVEALVFAGSMYLGEVTRFGEYRPMLDSQGWINVLAFVTLMMINMSVVGLYQRNREEGRAGALLRVGVAFALAVVEIAIFKLVLPDIAPWRRSILVALIVSFWLVLAVRYLFFKLMDEETLDRRVLVIGTGHPAQQIVELGRKHGSGFRVVGCVEIPGESDQVEQRLKVHLTGPLVNYARMHQIDEIVVAISDRRKRLPMHELMDCKLSGTRVFEFQQFYEQETGKVILDQLYPSWFIYSEGFRSGALQAYLKRGFDLLASAALLSIAWPIMLLASVVVWLEDWGKSGILFRQKRVGLDKRCFDVIKFRSMRADAEADGVARWATANDSRITPVGRFLRRTRIDELPQLWNVLKGDMSFVGPRPERPEFVETLSQRIPYYDERHRIRPGITGWAQVCYSYGASEEDAAEKLRFDLYYLKNHSLFLDLMIMIRTVEVVLLGRGAH